MMEYVIMRMAPDTLEHHGIKGQKWGVRRYENPDGTLTEAGKKRYQKDFYKTVKRETKLAVKNGEFKSDRLKKYLPQDEVKKLAPLVKKMNDDVINEGRGHDEINGRIRIENRSATEVEKKQMRILTGKANASIKAERDYAEKIASDLLGKYGNKKVTADRVLGINVKSEAKKIVANALTVLAIDEAYK